MSNVKILNGTTLPNIPWQPRPEGHSLPIWRYTENPIIDRNPIPGIARIFNSSVIPFEDGFIGVFRAEATDGVPFLYLGRSKDGIHWEYDDGVIPMVNEKGENAIPFYQYDPRLIKIEDDYYIVWCQDFYGASLGMAKTHDFKHFERLENPFIPFNRNGVLFPRKINGMYKLLSRPSDSGHTPFGDIFISESPDMVYWGKHRHVMGTTGNWWEGLKVGGGANPIETSEGWLLIYHGVCNTCNGYVYTIGGAILDIDEPMRKGASFRTLHSPARLFRTTRPAESRSITAARTAMSASRSPQSIRLSITSRKTTARAGTTTTSAEDKYPDYRAAA